MKRIFLILLFLFYNVSPVFGGYYYAVGSAGGGPEIEDDFSSDHITDITNNINVSGGLALNGVGSDNNWGYHTTQLSSANMYVEADCEWVAANTGGGVVVRSNGSGNDGFFFRVNTNSGSDCTVLRVRFENGATLGTHSFTFTSNNFSADTSYRLRIEVNNSDEFSAFIDWNSDGDFNDANESSTSNPSVDAAYTGQYCGVYAGSGSAAANTIQVDNLEASPL